MSDAERLDWKEIFHMFITHDCPPGREVSTDTCTTYICGDCWQDWWDKNKAAPSMGENGEG